MFLSGSYKTEKQLFGTFIMLMKDNCISEYISKKFGSLMPLLAWGVVANILSGKASEVT